MSQITVSTRSVADAGAVASQCAIVPIFARRKLSPAAEQVDRACEGAVRQALALGDFSGDAGSALLLPGAGRCKRVMLVGAGSAGKLDRAVLHKMMGAVYRELNGSKSTDAVLHFESIYDALDDKAQALEDTVRLLLTSAYRYTRTLSSPKPAMSLKRLVVNPGKALTAAAAKRTAEQGAAIAMGINVAKELANLPGNICTPSHLANEARKLARQHDKLSTSVLDEKKMARLGMGSLLSVTAGTAEPARLIVMEYQGASDKKQKPYVLVGKGITFDSGGISLKPGGKMDEMKFDMGGAASVLGTFTTLCELGLPINAVAIIAAAENMPSGEATKPGDVVTSMAGKTIEILNTDAEGRLVLCDALTYAERYKPAAVVDIATLTGACVVALGSHASALYSNQERLAEQLLAAGDASHDRAWRMPLWDDYQKQLDSNFADMANIGGPGGGSITAACFLSRFAENYPWAHLDIAGSAWDSAPKGATGRPVGLLSRYLIDRAGRKQG